MSNPVSVFAQEAEKGYKYRFHGHVVVEVLAGGTPTNPDVAESWLKAKGYGGPLKDDLLRRQVAEVMEERGVSEDEAVEVVAKNRHLTGFKRLPDTGELYIDGRQLKACIKEAASVAADVGRLKPRGFGQNSRKGVISYLSEHVFVIERRLMLGVTEPTDVHQSFVHTFRGSGIQLLEVVEEAEFDFTVETDHDFKPEEWATIWSTAEREGVGAARSQGYGRFTVTEWDPISSARRSSPRTSARRRKVAA